MWNLETLKILNDKRVQQLEEYRRKKNELAKWIKQKAKEN